MAGSTRISTTRLFLLRTPRGTQSRGGSPLCDRGNAGRVTIAALVCIAALLTGCSDSDDDGPASPQRPEGVFFGDLHVHSKLSDPDLVDESRPVDVFTTARDRIGLDFMALTDHDFWVTPEEWDEIRPAATAFNDPGSFVAFSAIEWTHRWHMNVIFKGDDVQFCHCPPEFEDAESCSCAEASEFDGYYRGMIEGGEATAQVNHPRGLFPPIWSMIDDTLTRNVEVWNAASVEQELGINSAVFALQAGFRFGFVGVSDDHMTSRPDPLIGKGITGCPAGELNREALLDALQARRCFATTGERIIVDLQANGTPMGGVSTATIGSEIDVAVQVFATAAPVTIELVKNGHAVDRAECEGMECEADLTAVVRDPNTFLYARVRQGDGGRAWSSPIWFEGSCPDNDTACLEPRLSPGGGDAADDCLAQFLVPEDGSVHGYDLEAASVRCTNGDPNCDVGNDPNECHIDFGLCFGVANSALPACAADRPRSFEIEQPTADARPGTLDRQNRNTVSAILRATHTTTDKPPCSGQVSFRVPVGESRTIELVARNGEREDRDSMVLHCEQP